MKRKIFNVLFALVLVLGMSLVMAVPAVATDVTSADVAVVPATPTTADADYTITFNVSGAGALAADAGTITIVFQTDTAVVDDDAGLTGTVNDVAITAAATTPGTRTVVITTPVGIAAGAEVVVVLTAGITNPAAGTYTLTVKTSADAGVIPSETYVIKEAQATVVLGTAAEFAVLAGSTVTNVVNVGTIVTGDLGVSPGTAVTGFPPGVLVGAKYTGAGSAAGTAQLDLTTAYGDAAGRLLPTAVAGNIGGQTLTPGLYKSDTSLEISSGELYLDAQGDPAAVFIFQMGSTFTMTSGRQIILTNEAKAANVFWQVGSSATLGTTAVFKGTILAQESITVNTGATVEGRLLARTAAVTLDANIITLPDVALDPVWLYSDDIFVADYATIQEAIDAATPGDTIIVGSGTYNAASGETFPIEVNKANLTIQSALGAATTIIAPTSTDQSSFEVTAAGVTIGGSGTGFTIGSGGRAGIYADVTGGDGITVQGNIFKSYGNGESRGMWFEKLWNGALITGNSFTTPRVGTGIMVVNADGATISNNTVATGTIKYSFLTFKAEAFYPDRDGTTAHVGPYNEFVATTASTINDVTITGNSITGVWQDSSSRDGIVFATSTKGSDHGEPQAQNLTIGVDGVTIFGNTFKGNNVGIGIEADEAADDDAAQIAHIYGVDNIQIVDNYFDGNDLYAVYNGQTTAVDAERNWWGDATGPTHATNPTGTGDPVSDGVDFTPLLAAYPGALTVQVQPSTTVAGVAIAPPVQVKSVDEFGDAIAGDNVVATLQVGTGVLSGTTTQLTDALGIATFNDLSISQEGTKVLHFTAGTITVDSNAFSITSAGGGGGGGGGGGLSTLNTNLFGTTGYFDINSSGIIQKEIKATSADGKLTITIPKYTKALDKNGKPLHTMTASINSNPPSPPANANIIGLAYNFAPDGATFDPPIIFTWSYDPAALPTGVAEEDLVIAYYDTATGKWVELQCVVDTANNKITASVSHYTTFAIIAYTSPAAFTTRGLVITPSEVNTGVSATIKVTVANNGDLSGTYDVVLKVNNTATETKTVTVNGHTSAEVTFSLSRTTAGTYTIDINGLSGQLEVKAIPTPPPTTPAPTTPAPTTPAPTTPAPTIPAPTTPAPTTPVPTTPAPTGLSGWLIALIVVLAVVVIAVIVWLVAFRRRS